MRRTILGTFAAFLLAPAPCEAQTVGAAGRRETARAVSARQHDDGGFSEEPGGPSSLGTTTASIRVLRDCGAAIPDVLGCIAFVRSCFDEPSGGFVQRPGAAPDVSSTALGLMALGELRVDDEAMIGAAVGYLAAEADNFPEIRIAAAGLEAVGRGPQRPEGWPELVLEGRDADGTWGDPPHLAFETAGRAVALLRMGVELDGRDAVRAAIRDGQTPEGGWPGPEGRVNLASCYRVARGAFMLDAPFDRPALRSYIAGCRRPDGLYAPDPEAEETTVGATYMAMIMLRWIALLENLEPVVETAGYVPLVAGEDLGGWEGDRSLWSFDEGALVGSSPGLVRNAFLATEGRYRDFTLRFAVRLAEGRGNSGVQFRSERGPDGHEMVGYQADIGEEFWGSLYDESRRREVLAPASEAARASVDEEGWNRSQSRANGDRVRLTLNDTPSVDYVEPDEEIARDGRIAVQLHSGGPMEVRFRDLLLQPMPHPTPREEPNEPGFHLRTLRGSDPAYRYALYVPGTYGEGGPTPVVLFLHGAGERGEDGALPTKVGLGPVIEAGGGDFPFLAVFPQARQTWLAGSVDAEMALAALDEVMADYEADRSRVVLAGISMGGMGAWSIGAAHPGRFSALVPICGPGDPGVAPAIRTLPAWAFIGDEDRPVFLSGMREMARALLEEGAPLRYTEYLGVGHNSWDRAFSDPDLVEWMSTRRRVSGLE